jgi:hypothetical protein
MPVVIQRISLRNHLLRDINADTRPEASGQGLGQPSHATPEVQNGATRVRLQSDGFQVLKNSFDLRISGGHEFCDIPLTAGFTFVGKNGAQRIPLREELPVSLQTAQLTHKETPTYSRICLIAGARVRHTDGRGAVSDGPSSNSRSQDPTRSFPLSPFHWMTAA